MALVCASASTDRVEIADAASIQTPAKFTAMGWLWTRSNASSETMFRKGTTLGTGYSLQTTGTSGALRLSVGCSGGNADYRTSTTPIATLNKWTFVACQWNGIGNANHIWSGDFSTPAVEASYGTSTNGSGSQNSDSGTTLGLLNIPGGGSSFSLNGGMEWFTLIPRALTIAEIIRWQFSPWILFPDAAVLVQLGDNGTQTVVDQTQYKNNGTVTTATVGMPFPWRRPPSFGHLSFVPAGGVAPVVPWTLFQRVA